MWSQYKKTQMIDHVTPVLKAQLWLLMSFRINPTVNMTYKNLHNLAPLSTLWASLAAPPTFSFSVPQTQHTVILLPLPEMLFSQISAWLASSICQNATFTKRLCLTTLHKIVTPPDSYPCHSLSRNPLSKIAFISPWHIIYVFLTSG